MNCADCISQLCYQGNGCSQAYDFSDYVNTSIDEYTSSENNKIMNISSNVEATSYMKLTRLEEIIKFAQQMGYKRIGIAHCIGLIKEAKLLKGVLEKTFAVNSICCKFSGIDKKQMQLLQIDDHRYEAICNPIGQAMVLNDLQTDMNIIVGLCVGHDMLFTKYSSAPVTTFIVKDRLTGHNPAVSLYSQYLMKKITNN
jgi:uncharacterized metal-binding protein